MNDTQQLLNALDNFTERELDQLPDSLFPGDDIHAVNVLGIDRKLRALPLRTSKKISAVVDPLRDKINAGDIEERVEHDAAGVVGRAVKIIATAYGWDDVVTAVDHDTVDDYDVSLYELQAVIARQSYVNGTQDYLLSSLRWLVLILQYQCITQLATERDALATLMIPTPSTKNKSE